jgi:GNAT superfamily N-acetyltransferase
MNIEIQNSKEDQYGNIKENIFLAFDDKGNYLGSAYAYPSVNYHQTYETPYLIFINVSIADNMDKLLGEMVRQKLFDKVFLRAKELRMQKPDLKARIYSGFECDKEKLDFYIENGFQEDYITIMEAVIPENFKYTLPESVRAMDVEIKSEQEFLRYKTLHDEIFVTPLDIEVFKEQENQKHFKNLSFIVGGKIQGGCTIFEKDGIGYVEALYVLAEKRGSGLSKDIVKYIFDYFLSKGLNKTKLEVWELNKRAVKLYMSMGYTEVKKAMMFPGISI